MPSRACIRTSLHLRHLLVCAMTTLALSAANLHAGDSPRKPTRIVSMNLCTDELVLRLADLRNIASVTWLSRGRSSNVVALAEQVPINHGLAEEVIPLDPDLVLAGTYTTRTAVALLKRADIPLVEIDVPRSIDEARRQYIEVGDILGTLEKGERIVADMDERLAKLAANPPSRRPRAIVLNPNGITVGPDTLANDVITLAGLDNVASRLKIDNYGQAPLETIVTQGVEVLIVSASRDGPPALATEVLKHPVIARIADRTRIVVMPTRMWACGGPSLVDAVQLLRDVAKDVSAKAGK
jgi:iron complex transport system substrate-binding protein